MIWKDGKVGGLWTQNFFIIPAEWFSCLNLIRPSPQLHTTCCDIKRSIFKSLNVEKRKVSTYFQHLFWELVWNRSVEGEERKKTVEMKRLGSPQLSASWSCSTRYTGRRRRRRNERGGEIITKLKRQVMRLERGRGHRKTSYWSSWYWWSFDQPLFISRSEVFLSSQSFQMSDLKVRYH